MCRISASTNKIVENIEYNEVYNISVLFMKWIRQFMHFCKLFYIFIFFSCYYGYNAYCVYFLSEIKRMIDCDDVCLGDTGGLSAHLLARRHQLVLLATVLCLDLV